MINIVILKIMITMQHDTKNVKNDNVEEIIMIVIKKKKKKKK